MKTAVKRSGAVKAPDVTRPAAGTATATEADQLPREADARTRDRVAKALYTHGELTVAALAEELGFTAPGVRRHLDALIADGIAHEVPERVVSGRTRGRGRPARMFGLTEAGHASFPHAYDDLAISALRFLVASGGQQAIEAFARNRADELQARYTDIVAGLATPLERAQALAGALSADGYAASATETGSCGVQVCQHHCPVQHVAEEFPALCDAETEAFEKLLGTHVQRLATIGHGDGVCTTHVPLLSINPASITPTSGRTSS